MIIMCQSKAQGGERCAAHTGQELSKAAATAKSNPSAENNEKLKDAMEAYNRTATGTKELRARGDEASVELADRYDAERKARRVGRKEAKDIAANHREHTNRLLNALHYDEQPRGYELYAMEVGAEPGDDGRTPVTLTYGYSQTKGQMRKILEPNAEALSRLANRDTLDEDLETIATSANKKARWSKRQETIQQHYKPRLDEQMTAQFGDNWENSVNATINLEPIYNSDQVRAVYAAWQSDAVNENGYLTDEELRSVSDHPLALVGVKGKAAEALRRRQSGK